MREGLPSLTAASVAYARAVTIDDPVAARVFPWVVRGPIARLASFGLVDHIALRTAMIDEALAPGFPQLVLLGAGLDARAYRLPSLANACVFEVDHPASRALKLKYVEGLLPVAKSVVSVPADFLKDDVETVLAEAGHDATKPTAWVIEGVAVYLPRAITERVTAIAAKRSAPGSLLAMTYAYRSRLPIARVTGGVMLRAIGEPIGDVYRKEEMHALVEAAGFRPISDTNDQDWSRRHHRSALLAQWFRDERLVIATK
jgi:methyltransferase (TIGR00027 family)